MVYYFKLLLFILVTMIPTLLHIYGPFSIQSYGVAIVCGIICFLYAALRNPLRKKYISSDQFVELIQYGILAGIVGGRVLHFVTEPENYSSWIDIFKLWEGGFSILGTIIAVTCFVPLYTYYHTLSLLPLLDLVALYAPLVQAISRIGCFFAGCCYGMISSSIWAVTYTHPGSMAPLYIPMHPTQLYSSTLLFIIFLVMRYGYFPYLRKPGTLFALYLITSGMERFIVDFWRADRVFSSISTTLSVYQLIACGLMICGIVVYFFFSQSKKSYGHL